MGGIDLRVTLDIKAFEELLNVAAREVPNAAKNAVNRAARSARREAIKIMARDIGAPASRFRSATPLVSAARPGNLSARWTIKPARIGLLEVGKLTPVRSRTQGTLNAATYRLSGGGSSRLIAKAFVIPNKSGKVFTRTGSGRYSFKAMWAESPHTSMQQVGAAPRRMWEMVADSSVRQNLEAEVAKALAGQAVPDNSGAD